MDWACSGRTAKAPLADRENEMSREADHRGVRLVAALAVAAALTAPASATARAGQTLLEQQGWGWWGLLAALAA